MKRILVLWLVAALLLGSCNFGGQEEPESPSPSPRPLISAEVWPGPDAGEYFNAEAACVLSLDGNGAFALTAAEGALAGTYTSTETELLLSCGGEELRAFFSGGGITLSGMRGIFLPSESLTVFSELGLIANCDREYGENGDGSRSLSDYGLQLGLQYPETMSAPENLIADAVVIWDGDWGYVVGRNVTEEFSGEAEDFLSGYMTGRIPSDLRLLLGEAAELETTEMLSEGVAGRVASAEATASVGTARLYVKCIMYTSTYSDGTVNYICKCFIAPEGDQKTFNALANGVVNMTAVRRR